MLEFCKQWFDPSGFMPHGYCYLWQAPLVWLQVLTNAGIAIAYFSIPIALVYFVKHRQGLAFNWIFLLFSLFIFSCGLTHLFDIITIWRPFYWLDGWLRAFTALVSIGTAIALWFLIPKALQLPSTRQLEEANQALGVEIRERERAEKALRQAHTELERRVEDRTCQLQSSEERYRSVVEGVRDIAIITLDPQGKITSWNTGAESIFGYSEDSAIGMSIELLSVPEDIAMDVPKKELLQAKENGKTADVRWHLRKDGTRLWATGSCNALYNDAAQLTGFVKVVGDNTEMKRNEIALKESERRFRSTFELTAVGIAHVDESYRFLRVNHRFADMLGYKDPSELTNKTVFDITHPDDWQQDRLLRAKLIKGELKSVVFEKRYVKKDGRPLWVQLSVSLAQDLEKDEIYTIAVAQDISERLAAEKALRESEKLFRQLADNIREVFWIFDIPSVKPIYFSPAVKTMYGLAAEEILQDFNKVLVRIHAEDRERIEQTMQLQLEGQETYAEFRYYRGDEIIWLAAKAFPLRNEVQEVYRVVGITEDITERKKFEEQLKRAKDDAERANQAKSLFLSNMSHEIRTPLNAILGFSELLLDPHFTGDERAQFIATIKRNGQSLVELIDDILDLSKVEAGSLQIEAFKISLVDLMRDIIQLFAKQAASNGIDLQLEVDGAIPETIISDPKRLKQILINIVGNAIKFTSHGAVIIKIYLDKTYEEKLVFDVQDSGIGIKLEQQEHLFKRFSQADPSTTRRFGGTGLGLVLSRHLARLLGGDVFLKQSAPGQGSVFSVHLPTGKLVGVPCIRSLDSLDVEAIQKSMPSRATNSEKLLMGIRVLVAEDSFDNQMLIRQLLLAHGAKVEVAGNGEAAVNKARQVHFDVILMDIQMPQLDGYEATAMLRRYGVRVPIIALTAHAMKEERARALAQGFDEYITKPINKKVLVETLARLTAGTHGPESEAAGEGESGFS